MNNNITISLFDSKNRAVFKALNIAWLEKYFEVEPIDHKVLSDPETYIIKKGGHIFFAKSDNNIVGTVALIRVDDATVELSKMAVDEAFQGQGIGKVLIHYCFEFAQQNHIKTIIL